MAYPYQDVKTYQGNCSKLTDYILLTPRHFGSRNNIKIDTITLHCTAGHNTAQGHAQYFYDTSNEASCNYIVGSDAKIALIVDEANRSWCSSSSSNDKRAITIEVDSSAYDTAKYGYCEVYNSVINKTIDLLVDICTRYSIAPLKWEGNVELIGQVDKQNMTVHRWFSTTGKTCPGGYLYSKHTEIANKVNEKLKQLGVINEDYVNTYNVLPSYRQKDGGQGAVSYKTGTTGTNYNKVPSVLPNYLLDNIIREYWDLRKDKGGLS